MTSALVGIAVKGGALTLDGPARIAEWSAPGDPRNSISVNDLLRMSSGLRYTRTPTPAAPDSLYGAHFWLRTPTEYRGPPAALPSDVFHAVAVSDHRAVL